MKHGRIVLHCVIMVYILFDFGKRKVAQSCVLRRVTILNISVVSNAL